MSLINDALKRARETASPAPHTDHRALEPARDPHANKLPYIFIPLAFVVVVAMGVWFVVKGIEVARRFNTPVEAQISAREPGATTPPSASTPLSETPSAPAAPAQLAAPASQPVVPPPASTPAPTVNPPPPATATAPIPAPAPQPAAPPPPPEPETLKLQAVFYNAQNPSVIINSQTLRLGQRIDDLRVLAISRQSVLVEWKGEKRELFLP